MLKFSIVTPSFNQAKYLERTLQSVAGQRWPLTEHIVVDGGSTDGSVEILRAWTERLGAWVSERDNGQSDAINKGLGRCTGDIVGWLNSDDVYLPGAFAAVGNFFERNPQCDACYGGLVIIDEHDCVTNAFLPPPPAPGAKYTVGVALDVHQQALFIRRRTLISLGGIDATLRFCMDYDLVCRLLLRARVGRVGRLLGALRHHGETKTATIAPIGQAEGRMVQQRYAREAGLPAISHARVAALRCERIIRQMQSGGVRYLSYKALLRAGINAPQILKLPSRIDAFCDTSCDEGTNDSAWDVNWR